MSAGLSDLFLYHEVTIVFSHLAGPSAASSAGAINGFSQEDAEEKAANRGGEERAVVPETRWRSADI